MVLDSQLTAPVLGQQFDYTFDDTGNRKTATQDTRQATYTPNNLNQYTSRTVPGYVNVLGTASNNATVTLWGDNGQYSPTTRKGEYFRGELYANNATGAVWLTITNVAVLNNGANPDIVTNAVGRTFVPKTTETFAYDADGNLTNDGRWSYTWDAENRITSFTRISSAPSGAKVKVDCQYDSRWRRTQKIVSTWNGSAYVAQSTNKFVYDGWNLIAILDHQSTILYSFTWGTDASGTMQGAGGVGGLISVTVHQGTNAGTYFYCYDGNHNVVALVNAASGAIAGQWEYDAFGNLLRATGTMASENPFLFSTKFYDWETGYYYYGYRYYDPDTGRWPNRDPLGEPGFEALRGGEIDLLGDGQNLYQFVKNNPVTWIDLLGLKRQLTPEEQKKVQTILDAIRQCAQNSKDKDVIKALDALDLKGIFDANDVKKDPTRQNDSETWFGPFWLESDTWLAADFFKDNNTWNDKVRAEVLIHEGWHAWKKAVQEEKAYKFGSDKCDSLWKCIKDKLGIK